jgi:hypothetical protein
LSAAAPALVCSSLVVSFPRVATCGTAAASPIRSGWPFTVSVCGPAGAASAARGEVS